eukprot:gnl/Dysnectes_brevis/4117_a5418_603.p1 GENE.gnl/Dysnectes_brevis/4117_a5418_603~~gnl/Dysnectes_brevis/4117_a5418_603.p1  ORF type:complete len:216 (-),score=26.41 gnl/Dysnectes_brevis/4117_a5418_603:303-950(-)
MEGTKSARIKPKQVKPTKPKRKDVLLSLQSIIPKLAKLKKRGRLVHDLVEELERDYPAILLKGETNDITTGIQSFLGSVSTLFAFSQGFQDLLVIQRDTLQQAQNRMGIKTIDPTMLHNFDKEFSQTLICACWALYRSAIRVLELVHRIDHRSGSWQMPHPHSPVRGALCGAALQLATFLAGGMVMDRGQDTRGFLSLREAANTLWDQMKELAGH